LSFLLDPVALLILGFVASKSYSLLGVFGARVLRRGELKTGLIAAGAAVVGLFWCYSALLYVNSIRFPWPLASWYGGTDWMLNSGLPLGLTRSPGTDALAVVSFAIYPLWFYAGARLGRSGHRQTVEQVMRERGRIVQCLADSVFPAGGAIPPGASQVDSAALVDSLFQRIPPLYEDALTMLLFALDSRFLVLALTGKFTRFVDLGGEGPSTPEKQKYLEKWSSDPRLASVGQILRITASYGYYTRPQVYGLLGYIGPMTPNLPPWFVPTPAEEGGRPR
jgi:hypothetical protein